MATTQTKVLLKHLERGQTIDPLEAMRLYGIYRLGARVYDLRAKGHLIERELVEVKNRMGGTARIARYSLVRY